MEEACANCRHWSEVATPSRDSGGVSVGEAIRELAGAGACRRFPKAEEKLKTDICGEWAWNGKGQRPEGAPPSPQQARSQWGQPIDWEAEGKNAIDILRRSVAKETPPPRPNPARRVCSYCKVEYEKGELGARVSHGMCPACVKLLDALQAAGYGAGQANDILIGMGEGATNPHDWPLPRLQPVGRSSVAALLGALVDWHAAHHQDEEEGE